MRILIVGQWFVSEEYGKIIFPGGTERYVYALAKQLIEDGYTVKVLSATNNNTEVKRKFLDGIEVHSFKAPNKFYGFFIDFLSFINTIKTVKSFNPDVAHVVSTRYRFSFGAILALKLLKKKIVFTRTNLPNKKGRMWVAILIDNSIISKIIQKVDVIISLSDEMQNSVIQELNPKKMVIIPNPFLSFNYPDMDKELNSILFVGRLDLISKAIDQLIKALYFVQLEVADVKLHICGNGDEYTMNYLSDIISNYNLQNNVIFHGHLNDDELAEKYTMCEMIVLPYTMEGAVSYVMVEAMCAGLPIVAYDLDCFCDVLDGGKFGILVKKGDVNDLANQLIKLLKNDELRRYYSKKSLDKSNELSNAINKIEEIYGDIT